MHPFAWCSLFWLKCNCLVPCIASVLETSSSNRLYSTHFDNYKSPKYFHITLFLLREPLRKTWTSLSQLSFSTSTVISPFSPNERYWKLIPIWPSSLQAYPRLLRILGNSFVPLALMYLFWFSRPLTIVIIFWPSISMTNESDIKN